MEILKLENKIAGKNSLDKHDNKMQVTEKKESANLKID